MGAERIYMRYNPDVHHRHSIRLKEYDYSKEGMYFITICTKERECMLSEIVGADDPVCPRLTTIGKMVNECWYKMNQIYESVTIHDYIIMPNHLHGIIEIQGGQSRPPLQKIIQGFKSVTTRNCFSFGYQKIWQRNYYEHIIRNEKELYKIIEYIKYNPLNWKTDSLNNIF